MTAIVNEKPPWESYTYIVAFVGVLLGFIERFNLVPGMVITPDLIAEVSIGLFLLVMVARAVGSGGKIVIPFLKR